MSARPLHGRFISSGGAATPRLLIALLLAAALTACAESDAPISDTGTGGSGNPGTGPALRCTTPTETSPTLGTTFNVHFGGQSTIASEGLTLSFDEVVHDTRCPTGVVCPVAGDASVVIRVADQTHNASNLTLTTESATTASGSYHRYVVELVEVRPHPAEGRAATPEADYCVELHVTRN